MSDKEIKSADLLNLGNFVIAPAIKSDVMKKRKMTMKERNEKKEEEIEEMARDIYMKWKKRLNEKKGVKKTEEELAEEWLSESDDIKALYLKTANIEDIFINETCILKRKKDKVNKEKRKEK